MQVPAAAQLVSSMDVKMVSGALVQPWSLGNLKKLAQTDDHLSVIDQIFPETASEARLGWFWGAVPL